jgi:hypothetical protein
MNVLPTEIQGSVRQLRLASLPQGSGPEDQEHRLQRSQTRAPAPPDPLDRARRPTRPLPTGGAAPGAAPGSPRSSSAATRSAPRRLLPRRPQALRRGRRLGGASRASPTGSTGGGGHPLLLRSSPATPIMGPRVDVQRPPPASRRPSGAAPAAESHGENPIRRRDLDGGRSPERRAGSAEPRQAWPRRAP